MSDLPERIFEQALTAVRGRDNNRALELLVEAIKIKPDFAEAWIVRGNVLHSTERHFDALLHYDRALQINDKLHDAWNNRGLAFGDIGLYAAAEESFRHSAKLLPAIEPHMGLANMFCATMRLEEAEAEYRKAIECDPGNPEAHFNLGVTLLGLGRWEEGFREYEWRWGNTPYPPKAFRNYTKWKGQDLNGKTILLYPEQGYGDEIMAFRFANEVKQRHPMALIIVLARGPFMRLASLNTKRGVTAALAMMDKTYVRTCGGGDIFSAPLNSDTEWKADYSCPLLDVPGVLGLTPSDLPRPNRYLSLPRAMVADWKTRLDMLPKALNVGLCWFSGGHLNTARAAQQSKSIPLHHLKGLALTGVNLISLQKPTQPIPDGLPITDWMDDCHDFADTAALIESLDCVVSVDTAVAHLAGALGTPTANFVRFSGYWPWLAPDPAQRSASKSIWYPSMTLFRQPALLDWRQPIADVTQWVHTQKVRKFT